MSMRGASLDGLGTRICVSFLTWLLAGVVHLVQAASPAVEFPTEFGRFTISGEGALVGIHLGQGGRNWVASGESSPLLSLRIGGEYHPANRAAWDQARGRLTLGFGGIDAEAILGVETRATHVVFEVQEVRSSAAVELVLWGPYPTAIGDIIGETIGVVRDSEVAVGIQALNAKTIGGYPTQESDVEAGFGADDQGDYADLPKELGKGQSFRGTTARPAEFGSTLQAYCRNRDRDRVIANWGHDAYVASALDDGGMIGSKIALFVCPTSQVLEVIGAIEVAEGLPHPMLDGVWGKVSPDATCSYLIVDFGEETIERAVEMTRRAGLRYLYHSSPFETWGHFKLKPGLFPRGWDSFKACVEIAAKAGVHLGFHTLSNFITPNDAYVTPVPDSRLAAVGSSRLVTEMNASQTEVPIESPLYFQQATTLNTVRIGQELIRYGSVSVEAPWRLLECERGAWGTGARSHATGTPVAKLMDHSYQTFLTDAELSQEVARNIARFCNETGARQLSFDGLEGNWATGLGQYGRTLFTQAWYEALEPGLRGQVINDASNPGHFNWHIYTRMNWGEPWYAGFRESQTLYRFKNQLYFERNLMPRMLGWFALRPDTSLEDAEWLLARAAGFDAGFTLATSLASTAQLEADPHAAEVAREFGAVPAILDAIRQWETARMARAFPADLRAALCDNNREFHLQASGAGAWDLYEYHLQRLSLDTVNAALAETRFGHPFRKQPLQWIIRNVGKDALKGLKLSMGPVAVLDMKEQAVPAGGAVRYDGGEKALVCDSTWRPVHEIAVQPAAAEVEGDNARLSLAWQPQTEGSLKIEFRTVGPAIRIAAQGSQKQD